MKSCHEPDPNPSSCCAPVEPAPCCGKPEPASCCPPSRRIDWLLWGSLALVAAGITGHFIGTGPAWWHTYAHGTAEFMARAWWGLLAGILAVGVIARFPQDTRYRERPSASG